MNVTLSRVYVPMFSLRWTQFFQLSYHSHALKISKTDFLIKYYNQDFLMPTTRKQKKARKSRGAEMLSDIKSLDNMSGGNHLEREESEYSDPSRRLGSPSDNAPEYGEENHYPKSRENRSGNSADYGHIPAGTNSNAEFNRLSGELNLRISREMDEVMNSLSDQIQRDNNNGISHQVLP